MSFYIGVIDTKVRYSVRICKIGILKTQQKKPLNKNLSKTFKGNGLKEKQIYLSLRNRQSLQIHQVFFNTESNSVLIHTLYVSK